MSIDSYVCVPLARGERATMLAECPNNTIGDVDLLSHFDRTVRRLALRGSRVARIIGYVRASSRLLDDAVHHMAAMREAEPECRCRGRKDACDCEPSDAYLDAKEEAEALHEAHRTIAQMLYTEIEKKPRRRKS